MCPKEKYEVTDKGIWRGKGWGEGQECKHAEESTSDRPTYMQCDLILDTLLSSMPARVERLASDIGLYRMTMYSVAKDQPNAKFRLLYLKNFWGSS